MKCEGPLFHISRVDTDRLNTVQWPLTSLFKGENTLYHKSVNRNELLCVQRLKCVSDILLRGEDIQSGFDLPEKVLCKLIALHSRAFTVRFRSPEFRAVQAKDLRMLEAFQIVPLQIHGLQHDGDDRLGVASQELWQLMIVDVLRRKKCRADEEQSQLTLVQGFMDFFAPFFSHQNIGVAPKAVGVVLGRGRLFPELFHKPVCQVFVCTGIRYEAFDFLFHSAPHFLGGKANAALQERQQGIVRIDQPRIFSLPGGCKR